MKSIFYLFTILLTSSFLNAQEISYGPILGVNSYDIEVEGPLSSTGASSSLNFGGFIDYNFKGNFGIRGNLIYNSINESEYYLIENGIGQGKFLDEVKLNMIQIQGLLKYDVSNNYNKGFYILGGLRMSNVLSAESNNKDVKEFYKNSNFGIMLGFGVNFLKHFGLELIPDYTITNTINSDNNKSKNFGEYLNLTFNLESLIK